MANLRALLSSLSGTSMARFLIQMAFGCINVSFLALRRLFFYCRYRAFLFGETPYLDLFVRICNSLGDC